MHTQIITIAMDESSENERQVLCAVCAAVCNRLAGVRATEWHVNHATNTVCGLVKWSEYEMIAQGTETLCTQVASLRDADRILRCRDITCPALRRYTAHDYSTKPNTGFVQHPPDYDPRG
jgi:hypothetical protein